MPTVLALVSAVLVIGLAMGSLSTLSLQFSTKQLESMRAEMAARSAVANLVAKLHLIDLDRKLNPLDPQPSSIADEFVGGLTTQEGQHKVTIHFQAGRDGHSTDNLGGDAAAVGWSDQDDVARVAPFSLDVVVSVKGPTTEHRYRVGLRRVWPYALYAARGPMVLMSQPKDDLSAPDPFPFPSHVKGDVFTTWDGNGSNTNLIGFGLGMLDEPSKLMAFIEARNGYHPSLVPQHPLIIGQHLGYNEPILPTILTGSSDSKQQFLQYSDPLVSAKWRKLSNDPVFNNSNTNRYDTGNVLEGDLYYHHDQEDLPPIKPVQVPQKLETMTPDPENFHQGAVHLTRGLSADPLGQIAPGDRPDDVVQGMAFTALTSVRRPDTQLEDLFGIDPLRDDGINYDTSYGGPAYLLTEDLVLPNPAQSATHYMIDGSLSNRQVIYDENRGSLLVRQEQKGIQLQKVVLRVKGDLELGSIDPDGPGGFEVDPVTITGAGATLIVDGKLILGNAMINAQDQGFVVYAQDIVLKGGGDFRGLMIAKNSISILTQAERPLNIKGALLCAGEGGITFRGGTIEHDPQYLKGINGGGEFHITSWQKL